MESVRTSRAWQSGVERLSINDEMIQGLQKRAAGLPRSEMKDEILASVKCCPTRHGCTGATNCDCSLSNYNYGR